MKDERTGRRNSTDECLCSVATGPNAILVSPQRRRRFLPQVEEGGQRTEGDEDVNPRMGDPESSAAERATDVSGQPGDGEEAGATLRALNHGAAAIGSSRGEECNEMRQWWRETKGLALNGDRPQMLSIMGRTAVLSLEITGQRSEELLDTGASRSFISPERVQRLRLKVSFLPKERSFTLASAEGLRINRVVKNLNMWCGKECFSGEFLVGPIPYDIILGVDWLTRHKVTWYFQPDKFRTYIYGRWRDLPVERRRARPSKTGKLLKAQSSTKAEEAYKLLSQQVSRTTAGEAVKLVRPQSKRYKPHHERNKRVPIKMLLQEAKAGTMKLQSALDGLHAAIMLPARGADAICRLNEERQGPLLCALVAHRQVPKVTLSLNSPPEPVTEPVIVNGDDDEEPPWPTAKLDYTIFESWIGSEQALEVPSQVLAILSEHKLLFPDSLPAGLPPKRPYGHQILLLPGKLPTKQSYIGCHQTNLPFISKKLPS